MDIPLTKIDAVVRAVYRHFEGELVQVVRIVQHACTSESLILYSALCNPAEWKVTTVDEFSGSVELATGSVPRFVRTDIRIGTLGGLVTS